MSSSKEAFIKERKKLQCIVLSCLGKAVREAGGSKDVPTTATYAHDEGGGEEGGCRAAIMPPKLCSQIEDMATRLENDFPIFDSKDEEYEKRQLAEAMRLFEITWSWSYVNRSRSLKIMSPDESFHKIKMFFMANIPFYALDKEIKRYNNRNDDIAKKKQLDIQESYVEQLTKHLKRDSIVPVEIFNHHFPDRTEPTKYEIPAKMLYDRKINKQKQYNSKPGNTYVEELVNNSNQALKSVLVNEGKHPIQVLVKKWRERINKGYVYCDTQEKQSEAELAVKEALTYGNLDALIPFLHVMLPIYATQHFFDTMIKKYDNNSRAPLGIAAKKEQVVKDYKMELVDLYAKKNIEPGIEFEALVVFLMHPLHHTSKFDKIFTLKLMMRKLGGLIHAYRTGRKKSNKKEKLEALVKDSQTGQPPPPAEYVVAMQMRKENIAILLPKNTKVKGVTCLLTRVRQAKQILQYRLEDMGNQLDGDISGATLQKREIATSHKYQKLLSEYTQCDINTKDDGRKNKKMDRKAKETYKKILEPFKEKAESLKDYNRNNKKIPEGVIDTRCNKNQDAEGLVSKALINVESCTSAIINLLNDEQLMYLGINGSNTTNKRDFLKSVLEVVRQTVERIGNFIHLLEKLRKDKQSRKPLSYITSKLTEFNGDIHNCLKESALLLQGDGQFPN